MPYSDGSAPWADWAIRKASTGSGRSAVSTVATTSLWCARTSLSSASSSMSATRCSARPRRRLPAVAHSSSRRRGRCRAGCCTPERRPSVFGSPIQLDELRRSGGTLEDWRVGRFLVLRNLSALLAARGLDFSDVVKVTAHLHICPQVTEAGSPFSYGWLAWPPYGRLARPGDRSHSVRVFVPAAVPVSPRGRRGYGLASCSPSGRGRCR